MNVRGVAQVGYRLSAWVAQPQGGLADRRNPADVLVIPQPLGDTALTRLQNFADDSFPFFKNEFYGEIPHLLSQRSDGRPRGRTGCGWSRRKRGH